MNGVLCITNTFELGQSGIICFSKWIKMKLVFKIPPKEEWGEERKGKHWEIFFPGKKKNPIHILQM